MAPPTSKGHLQSFWGKSWTRWHWTPTLKLMRSWSTAWWPWSLMRTLLRHLSQSIGTYRQGTAWQGGLLDQFASILVRAFLGLRLPTSRMYLGSLGVWNSLIPNKAVQHKNSCIMGRSRVLRSLIKHSVIESITHMFWSIPERHLELNRIYRFSQNCSPAKHKLLSKGYIAEFPHEMQCIWCSQYFWQILGSWLSLWGGYDDEGQQDLAMPDWPTLRDAVCTPTPPQPGLTRTKGLKYRLCLSLILCRGAGL